MQKNQNKKHAEPVFKGKENYNSLSVLRHHSPNNCYMQFKFLNRCGMGLDVESQRLLSLITFKDWGKKHFEVQNKKSCAWLGVFVYHYDYHHHFFKKSDCEITGIPANHLVSLVWPLTDSSPCQSAFGFATFGSLSLSLSVSVCLSQAASSDKGCVFIKEPPSSAISARPRIGTPRSCRPASASRRPSL